MGDSLLGTLGVGYTHTSGREHDSSRPRTASAAPHYLQHAPPCGWVVANDQRMWAGLFYHRSGFEGRGRGSTLTVRGISYPVSFLCGLTTGNR